MTDEPPGDPARGQSESAAQGAAPGGAGAGVPPQGYDVAGTDSIAPPSRTELLSGAAQTAGDLARAGVGKAGEAARAGASAAGGLARAGAGRGWRAVRDALARARE